MAAFEPALAFTLKAEGGFSDDALDPGGATKYGITQATLARWRRRPCSALDVRDLGLPEAAEIYRAWYWAVIDGDRLPSGLDLVVLDLGVNASPARSALMLQRVVGAEPDGVVGPQTLAAAAGPAAVTCERIRALAQAHEDYYRTLPTWRHFGRGWMARCMACSATALQLAAPPSGDPVTAQAFKP